MRGMSDAPTLKLKNNAKGRVLEGHPWVFVNEVETLLPDSFDGQVVETAADFAGLVQQSPIGQPLPLAVIRDGQRTELNVELVERPQ